MIAIHLSYLIVLTVVGYVLGRRIFRRRLAK